MPIYEYRCSACEHIFEEWQKISDPPVKKCPKCKKSKVERLLSAPAFHLKGGGWYKDLYASVNKSESGTSESSSSSNSSQAAKETKESKSEGTKSSDTSTTKTSGSGGGKKKKAASA